MITNKTQWRKSSYSGQGGNDCVEMSNTLDAVRDSKNGVVLPLSRPAVTALVRAVKQF